jgi:hypothetical protein
MNNVEDKQETGRVKPARQDQVNQSFGGRSLKEEGKIS